MKRRLLAFVLCLLSVNVLFAQQWTTNGTNINNTNSGNVGVGTTGPAAKLDVNGTLQVYPSANKGGNGALKFRIMPGVSSTLLEANSDGDWVDHDIIINAANSTSGNTDQLVVHRTGKIGIGTGSPTERLHLHAPSGTAEFRLSDAVTGTASGRGIYFRMSSLQNADIINFENGKMLQFGTSGSPRLTIDGNGNIGIGTSSPQSELAVNGDIFSKKIKVTQSGWPDYVFHPTYNLRSLSELEQYIQQHMHLPEVPSAATIKKDGLDLGDNQAVLLKKVEELTLYIIEQNKRMEKLEKEMADLKEQKNK
ncbi:MAG: hypothetical protein J0I32_20245 [Sphingobacteriales bacterium]|nr:hypothetical protein [Sphingobacteriales bacterium]OJV97740.1 MAG: hypothetical protein BGO52_10210 [Sphingobacteriales bacterium 44-61]